MAGRLFTFLEADRKLPAGIKRALSLPKIQLNIKRVLRLFRTRSRTCVAFKGQISRYLRRKNVFAFVIRVRAVSCLIDERAVSDDRRFLVSLFFSSSFFSFLFFVQSEELLSVVNAN